MSKVLTCCLHFQWLSLNIPSLQNNIPKRPSERCPTSRESSLALGSASLSSGFFFQRNRVKPEQSEERVGGHQTKGTVRRVNKEASSPSLKNKRSRTNWRFCSSDGNLVILKTLSGMVSKTIASGISRTSRSPKSLTHLNVMWHVKICSSAILHEHFSFFQIQPVLASIDQWQCDLIHHPLLFDLPTTNLPQTEVRSC